MGQAPHLIDRARRLRRNATPFEAKLWLHISRAKLDGYKFRRQHVIANTIVDFFCPQKGLIVEIDGGTHDPTKDALRDEISSHRGYSTVRYSNAAVGKDIEGVLQHLLATLSALPDRWPHPKPSPEGDGK